MQWVVISLHLVSSDCVYLEHCVQAAQSDQAGQVLVLHSSVSSASPSHGDWPDLSSGRRHSLTLLLTPPPHDLLQGVKPPHSDQAGQSC